MRGGQGQISRFVSITEKYKYHVKFQDGAEGGQFLDWAGLDIIVKGGRGPQ